MTERPNKELADRYWSDQTLKAWYWSALDKCWVVVNNPWFGDDKDWHVGHEAPKEPPRKMCELAGIKFPMPMTEAPGPNVTYWTFNTFRPDAPLSLDGYCDRAGLVPLKAGTYQATREGAIQQGRAIAAAIKQAMEAAK